MAQLNEDQRLAVGLVLVEGPAVQGGGRGAGHPIGTLTSRLARARDSLQAILSGTAGVSA
jgi:RNA polymerase sigma-70 factor (ECF subfamily)